MMKLILSALSVVAILIMIKAEESSLACRPSPCLNGGRCILRNNERGYDCLCRLRYHGVNCNQAWEKSSTVVRYTIMNNVTDDKREFRYTKVIFAWVADFYDIMVKAADMDSHYKFNATYYEKQGYFITEINGLKQDAKAKLYWLLVIQRALKPWCRSAVGVSSYKPILGDHAMFTYNTWEEVAKLPECAKYG